MGREALSGKHPGTHRSSRHAAALPSAVPAVERLVHALEAEIIPRLVKAHRSLLQAPITWVDTPIRPSLAEVHSFADLVLVDDQRGIAACFAEWRLCGAGTDRVMLDLLAPAAREFGERWLDDRCSFTDVTIATGRVHRLMQDLSPAFWSEALPRADCTSQAACRRCLMLPAPGEQHTFGVSMLAEFFGRAGWDVTGPEIATSGHTLDRVRREGFDLVCLSVGSFSKLDGLSSFITSIRKVSRYRDIAVMVGGPLFFDAPELASKLGADGCSADACDALAMADDLFERRGERR